MKIESDSNVNPQDQYLVEQLLQSAQLESYASDMAQNWRHIVFPLLYFAAAFGFTRVFMHTLHKCKLICAVPAGHHIHEADFTWLGMRYRLSSVRTLVYMFFAYALVHMCWSAKRHDVWWHTLIHSRVLLWAGCAFHWAQVVEQNPYQYNAKINAIRMLQIIPLLYVSYKLPLQMYKDSCTVSMVDVLLLHCLVLLLILYEMAVGLEASKYHHPRAANEVGESSAHHDGGGYDSELEPVADAPFDTRVPHGVKKTQ